MSDAEDRGGGSGLEIALVGMSGRFPGADDLEEFWRNLAGGRESLRELTAAEMAFVPAAMRRSPFFVPVARTISNYDHFDAAFFGINPREAAVMDPQQRLFLECAWSALEHAGYDSERYEGAVGVYAGSRMNFYIWNVYSNPEIARAAGDLVSQIANEKDYVATRVSYKLNLGGPSITVQSACSSSLVAVHLACQGLLSGECDMALAGGVSLKLPEIGYSSTDGDVNSPDGHVRAFDARAAGTVFSSGMGAVVLKRLADAVADGDTIHAVIRGSAVTNDGSQKVGFTAPGVDGQYRVIRTALTVAEVEPREISYIEAHGTGTPVGDPIEISALTKAFREKTSDRGFCAVGTVKTNIGHLGAAAGVAGLIKTTLALKQRSIPPSLLFEKPNPQIDFDGSPFFVNTCLREWEANGAPRRAGVSAFGIGGTNAHVIVEEAPEPEAASPSRPWQLLLLSARTDTALETMTANLAAHLEAHPEDPLADVAYTLQVGRRIHEHRRALVCRDAEHAREVLRGLAPEWASAAFAAGREHAAAFLFSGQGSQYPGMGKGLYESEAAFAEQVDRCCQRLQPDLGLDLRDLLFAAEDDGTAAERLGQTRFTQPALFVVEYAVARLWMEWGIVPRAMLGHSIGEYVAACVAGVMSLDDALALVSERGRLMQSLPSGAMLAVPLPEAELAPLLGSQLSLAAVNAPGRCVVSGPHEAVEALRTQLADRGVAVRPLHTSHAFHSGMMEPILAPFLQRFESVELRPPQIPYISNVTGTWITENEATDPGYWARHLRQAVRFADGIRELCRDPHLVLLEVGPGNTLGTLARQHPERGAGRTVLSSLRHPKERQEDLPLLLKTLGQLWLHGVEPDWQGFYARERRRRMPLPTYPFERRRFWIDPGPGLSLLGADSSETRKKDDLSDWFYLPYWKPSLKPLPSSEDLERSGRWLLFLDDAGVGEAVATQLAEEGRQVVTARAGAAFCELAGGRYEIAPGSREDHDALISALVAAGSVPDCVLHLWNCGPLPAGLASEQLQQRSFWSPLYLAQALGKQNVAQPIRLVLASSHAHGIAGEDRLLAERAMLQGPAKVIPLEYPNLSCVCVDVEWPAGAGCAARLVAEATAGPSQPAVVAYRGGRRWVQSYEAVRLEETAGRSVRLRERGVYLITGGLGGLGLTFAEFLAREYRARLVLVGASALPDRADWDDWLRNQGESDRTSERIRKLRGLEALGAEVMAAGADVADGARMRALVGEAVARFGTIHGVIHAAGIAGGGMIQLKTAEMASRVISPKVAGTRTLADALAGIPLDFLVLCSSTIAVAGGLGQVDYCAANNFLDAFAHEMTLAGGPRTIAVNWGAWEEVGMAVASGLLPARGAATEGPSALARDLHPLLDRWVVQSADQVVFETDFDPSRHWVLNEHRIMGTPTLPGTTHLELARAAFVHGVAAAGSGGEGRGVELRDVFFFSPLMLPEGSRLVRISLEKEGDAFTFQVASRVDSAGRGDAAWQPHARGKVAPVAGPSLPGRYDISDLLSRCSEQVVEITGPALNTGEKLVWWGPHWQSLKRIHLGRGEGLARLELPEEFAAETEAFGLHPALLDVATGIASSTEQVSYLPLSYRRVRVHRPLPSRFFSYLRRHGEANTGGETLAVDIVILSDDGEVMVEIDHFTMKRVGEAAGALKRAVEAPAELVASDHPMAAAGEPVSTRVAAEESLGILPQEGVEALRRILSTDLEAPQIVATARDLHALMAQVSSANRAKVLEAAGAGGPSQVAIHARPNLPTPYAAPVTELERRLAAIWQSTLGIEQVGVDDNFFELGGDSILGIQLIARASEAGLQLAPDQLFEHQTIAGLAKVLGNDIAAAAETAAGPLPVTAYQRGLLATAAPACWFTVWPLAQETKTLPAREVLRQALAQVVSRHDALRTRFVRGPAGWAQAPTDYLEPDVREIELAGDNGQEGETSVEAVAAQLRAELDPERGGLVAAAVVSEGGGDAKRAVVVVHPLAADRTSWSILRDELRTASRQLAAGEEVSLPAAAVSFHRWLAERVAGAAEDAAAPGVPPAVEAAARTFVGCGTVSVRLDARESRSLLNEVPDHQRARVEEVLLAALAATIGRKSRRPSARIWIEVEAREGGPQSLDLSRAVGCFAAALPAVFDLGATTDPAEELRRAKEQFRHAAADGANATFAPPVCEASEVSFSYLGDAQVVRGLATEPASALEVTAQLDSEGLRFDWRAAAGSRFAAEVPAMAEQFLSSLRSLLDFCLSATAAVYTPSDFPDAELSQEELDKLFS